LGGPKAARAARPSGCKLLARPDQLAWSLSARTMP